MTKVEALRRYAEISAEAARPAKMNGHNGPRLEELKALFAIITKKEEN